MSGQSRVLAIRRRAVLPVLLMKDLAATVRGPAFLLSVVGLTITLVLIGSVAFRAIGMDRRDFQLVVPGVLWITVLFVSTIVLNRSLLIEREEGAYEGLLGTGVSAGMVSLSKMIANAFLLALLGIFITAMVGFFLDGTLFTVLPELFLLDILVVVGVAALGSILASVATATAGREVLLPLMLYPILIPHFVAAVCLSRELLMDGGVVYSSFWFLLLVVVDVVSVALLATLYEFTFDR